MSWTFLIIAGLFEIGWVIGLAQSAGFTRLWPTLATIISMILSLALLGLALRDLPIGTAYAVWTGIGAVGAVICGIIIFGEPAGPARLICIALIVTGIVGLKALA